MKMFKICPPFVLIRIRFVTQRWVWHKQLKQSHPEWLNMRVCCYYLPTLWWRGNKWIGSEMERKRNLWWLGVLVTRLSRLWQRKVGIQSVMSRSLIQRSGEVHNIQYRTWTSSRRLTVTTHVFLSFLGFHLSDRSYLRLTNILKVFIKMDRLHLINPYFW